MRKLFWSCFVGGVAVAAGVFTTAEFAVRNPHSYVGQSLFGAGQATAMLTGTPCCRCEKPSIEDETSPTYVGGEELAEPIEPTHGMPIVIPEDELIPPAPIPTFSDTLCPVPAGETFGVDVVAPAVMPRCEEECEVIPATQPEVLHFPREVYDGEEQEEPASPTGCGSSLMRLFHKMIRHTTGSGSSEQPACNPCHDKPRSSKMMLERPHGLFKSRIDQFCPGKGKIDTMEFRATDRQLYDYGFGPL